MIFSGLRLALFELVFTENYGFPLPLVVIITALSNLVQCKIDVVNRSLVYR